MTPTEEERFEEALPEEVEEQRSRNRSRAGVEAAVAGAAAAAVGAAAARSGAASSGTGTQPEAGVEAAVEVRQLPRVTCPGGGRSSGRSQPEAGWQQPWQRRNLQRAAGSVQPAALQAPSVAPVQAETPAAGRCTECRTTSHPEQPAVAQGPGLAFPGDQCGPGVVVPDLQRGGDGYLFHVGEFSGGSWANHEPTGE